MTRIGGSDTHDGGVFEVVMLDAMMPAFVEWLESRQCDLMRGPQDINEPGDGDDRMPWYIVTPQFELLRGLEGWQPTGIQNGGDDAVRT